MPGIEDAKSIKELSDVALVLFNQSVQAYHEVNLSMWEMATGARPFSADEAAKNLSRVAGTMARDAGNLGMVWSQLSKIAAPPAAPAPAPPAPGQAPKATKATKATAKKAAAKKPPAKKAPS